MENGDGLDEKRKKKKNGHCRGRLECLVGRRVEGFFLREGHFCLIEIYVFALIWVV